MSLRPTASLVLPLLLAGCAPTEPPRPSTPPVPSEVTKIDALEFRSGPSEATHEFTSSPAVIGGLLAFLRDHSDGWTVSKTELPKPIRTVTGYSGKIALLELSVGNDWIGGRLPEYAADEYRKRPLSEPERAQLRQVLDGPR